MTTYTQQEQFIAKKITAVVYNDASQQLDVTMEDESVDIISLQRGVTWIGPLIGQNHVLDERNRVRILTDAQLADDFSEVV